MKKFLVFVLIFGISLLSVSYYISCRHGGDAFGGAFVGSMGGSMIGSAMTKGSGGGDSKLGKEALSKVYELDKAVSNKFMEMENKINKLEERISRLENRLQKTSKKRIVEPVDEEDVPVA